MCPPEPDTDSRLARYTPDSRRWRYALAGISAVAAPVLFYYTVRLISSTWSGTLPSLLVLVGSALTLVMAALPSTLLLAPDDRTRREADDASEDAAVAELKRRYASGEISDAEFERRLETLIETPAAEQWRPSEAGSSRETGRKTAGVESDLS